MRSLAAAVVVLALAPRAARGDDLVEEARREFAAGQDADARHEWQTAIAHFLRANELVPHPNALYNIARDYEQLDQLREAARWYARYLELANDAAERAKIDKRIAALRARPSKIRVTSAPDAARVAIDGAQVGVTPYAGVATAGTHRVAVDKDGQRDTRDVALEFGEPADVAFALGGAAAAHVGGGGTLVVTGPPNATILVDGMAAGTTPAQLPVAPGPHIVSVQAFGFQPFVAQPFVAAGGVANVDAPVVAVTTTTVPIAYITLGATGGVDANTTTGLGLFYLGARFRHVDTLTAFGSIAGSFGGLITVRYTILSSRVTPFVAASLFFNTDGPGVQATGGLRWDVSRGRAAILSLLVEGGYRTAQGPLDTTTFMRPQVSTFPIMATLEVAFGLGARMVVTPR